jgi:hypothetical protein
MSINCLGHHKNLNEIDLKFNNLLVILNKILIKEEIILQYVNKFNPIMEKLIFENVSLIQRLFQIYVKIKLEHFKLVTNIHENYLLDENQRNILIKLNLSDNFEYVLKEIIKTEINTKIEELKNCHDKSILTDVIKYYLYSI